MEIEFSLHDGGLCLHPEKMVCRSCSLKTAQFPSMFALLKHPKHGNILYDTGYSQRFFEVTNKYPMKIYADITKVIVTQEDVATTKLKKLNISPKEINYIIISHFHADHYGAIEDFPNAKFIYYGSGFKKVHNMNPIMATSNAYISTLIPKNFAERSIPIDDKLKQHSLNSIFENHFYSTDLFGDQSIYAVHLPGHARGQAGLFFRSKGEEYFLIADAAWQKKNFLNYDLPLPIAYLLMDSVQDFKSTLKKIKTLSVKHPALNIIPSHCGDSFLKYVKDSAREIGHLNGTH
jgi:glyoxylase-like metal-dependent hydrolase (beta-lactamase superfamily II)